MASIRPGERARIWGPYGMFNELLFEEPQRPAVLIGGGIGITPMLSILHSDALASRPGTVHLIYAVPHADKRVYHDEIHRRAAQLPQVHTHEHLSDEQGFIDAAYLQSIVTGPLADHLFLVCGPTPMMHAVRRVLDEAGVPSRQISMEEFAIR